MLRHEKHLGGCLHSPGAGRPHHHGAPRVDTLHSAVFLLTAVGPEPGEGQLMAWKQASTAQGAWGAVRGGTGDPGRGLAAEGRPPSWTWAHGEVPALLWAA